MNKVDFGKLIASLRKEHDDEAGVPWTQAKLAEEANLAAGADVFTEYIIGSIERGNRNLDEQTLLALAAALQLTSGERKEFFLAACGVENTSLARQDNDPEEVLSQLMGRMEQIYIPSFILDSYYDVVAASPAVMELFDLESAGLSFGSQEGRPFPYNMVRNLFSDSDQGESHFGRLMREDWSSVLYETVRMFRVVSLRYRSTAYFQRLLQELNKSRRFRGHWQSAYFEEKDHYVDSLRVRFDSPRWGGLVWFHWNLPALTSAGELLLCMYVPASHVTARVFDQIVEHCGTVTPLRLPCWPEKRLP
jgi:transcriptional regulator with XRE-family HTH domain